MIERGSVTDESENKFCKDDEGKGMTQEGDLVLVYMEGNPAFFARIEAITPDVKPEWFQVKMLVLQVPVMIVTWILRTPYIDGEEFTMGGNHIRMVRVVSPEEEERKVPQEQSDKAAKERKDSFSAESSKERKVVSLFDRRKKDQPS